MPNGAGLEAKNVAGAMTSMHIDELISNLAIGIAQGQMQLDQVCMEIAQFMGDAQVAFGKRAGSDEPDLLSLIELGFSPNFYQFVDTILEVRVSVSTQFEESREYDTSQTQMHQDEYQTQSQYSSSRSSGYSSRSGGFSWWGWWWGGGRGYSSSSYGSSSSRYATSSSYKNKNVSLTTVDAKYASTYNYAVEGSSLVKTKIVPVPPPQVFEEIVRAKVQERRDWEQQIRWTDQARSILTTTSNTAYSIISDGEGLGKSLTTFKKDNAVNVRDSVLNLQDEYNQMTTDHWAVIKSSVRLREDADNALQKTIDGAQQLVDLFSDPDSTPSTSDIGPVLSALKGNLEAFKGKIEELLEKLPVEEEQTVEETQEQKTGESEEQESNG